MLTSSMLGLIPFETVNDIPQLASVLQGIRPSEFLGKCSVWPSVRPGVSYHVPMVVLAAGRAHAWIRRFPCL